MVVTVSHTSIQLPVKRYFKWFLDPGYRTMRLQKGYSCMMAHTGTKITQRQEIFLQFC